MDYFFQTFFSGNFREARNVTSVRYRQGRTHNEIDNEWRKFYREVEKAGWQVNNVQCLFKALEITDGNGLERTILTDKPGNPTHQEINALLVKEVAAPAGFKPSEVKLTHLVISEDWGRAILAVNKPGHEAEQIILRQIDGRWKIINYGTGITHLDYQESPYMLWVTDNWK